MEMVLIAAAVLLALAGVLLARRSPAPPRRDHDVTARRLAAEAEMEEHDIDDMLDAINARRAKRGARTTGEELADEALRAKWEADQEP